MFLRYAYPVLLAAGAVCGLTGFRFESRALEAAVLAVYYLSGAVSAATFFFCAISVPEALLTLSEPLLMALSPAPYETVFLIPILIAVSLKYKYNYKALVVTGLVLCTVIGINVIVLSPLFASLSKKLLTGTLG